MNIAKIATQNVKSILFAVCVLGLLGAVDYTSFPVSILPDVSFPRVIVIADNGDQPVNMIEAGVTRPIENAITTVPNVKRIVSRTKRGSTEISIDFDWGTDILTAEQLVNAKVNQVQPDLPAGTKTEVERMNPTVFPVVGLTLDSKSLSPSQLYELAQYTLRPGLARVPGVARVVVQGGRDPEIEVTCDPRKLGNMHLSLTDVSKALADTNMVKSVGRMTYRFQTFQVLVSGLAPDINQFNNVVVAQRGGQPVYLRDIATVQLNVADANTVVSANGKDSVLLNVIRQPSANSVTMADGVRQEIAKLKPTLPPGTKLGVFYDQSVLVREAIQSVSEAVLIGAILAVFVLMLFLRNVRATILTAAIIPMTVLITFLFMRVAGLTLNLMTLGALAVAIGLVIDDAIVVVENVFKHLQPGVTVPQAVQLASNEIARPMISSTLTTVVVFLPLSLLQGVAGAFFSALAITLTIALLVSLALALFASPSLCAAFLKKKSGEEHAGIGVKLYQKVLTASLKRKYVVFISAILLLFGTVFIAQRLQTGFMPEMDEGAFILDFKTDPGTSLAETDRLLNKVDSILESTPDIKSFSRRTGTELGFSITEPNTGDYAVMMKASGRRNINDVIGEIRTKIQRQVPGLDVDFSQVLQDLIGDLSGSPAPIEVKLYGENETLTQDLAKKIADDLGKQKGIVDIQSGVTDAGPQYTLSVDPERAGRMGLSPTDIANQVNAALFGDVATTFFQGDKEIPVRVRYPGSFHTDPQSLSLTPIVLPSGQVTQLGSVGQFVEQSGSTEATRENQRRMVDITARQENIDLGTAITEVQSVLTKTPMPPGITYEIGGAYKSQQDSFNNLIQVLMIAILLVFLVMLFQFGSFTSPIVILIVMPLGLFGAVAALWITGVALNVSSFMGAIMLVGIVVKNGILLLDRAQEGELEGMSVEEAVHDAATQRLRPILMTSLTAVLGLLPLALGIGAGAEMQQPLAIAVIGGLTFSTMVTLVAAPTLYAFLRTIQEKRFSRNGRSETSSLIVS